MSMAILGAARGNQAGGNAGGASDLDEKRKKKMDSFNGLLPSFGSSGSDGESKGRGSDTNTRETAAGHGDTAASMNKAAAPAPKFDSVVTKRVASGSSLVPVSAPPPHAAPAPTTAALPAPAPTVDYDNDLMTMDTPISNSGLWQPGSTKIGGATNIAGTTFADRVLLTDGNYAPMIKYGNGNIVIHPSWQKYMKDNGITKARK